MGWEGKAAAIGLALGMLGVPTASPLAQETSPIVRPRSETLKNSEYQLPLTLFERFVDIGSNPITGNIYEKISTDPKDHITIVDPLGNSDIYIPDTYSYYVYNEILKKDDPVDFREWSMVIRIQDLGGGIEQTSVSFQLNYSGHIYLGSNDRVVGPNELSISTKALQADYLFNIPDEMQDAGWFRDPSDPTSHIRQYYDPDLGLLTQRVGPSNAVTLEARYQKPVE